MTGNISIRELVKRWEDRRSSRHEVVGVELKAGC